MPSNYTKKYQSKSFQPENQNEVSNMMERMYFYFGPFCFLLLFQGSQYRVLFNRVLFGF
jgi:hypothetical protein